MATTKTTKQAAARKPAAKKTTARKPAAKKTTAKKTTAKKVETKRPPFDMPEMPDMDEVNERFDEIATDVVKFWRDTTYTSVGVPLVVQDRIAERDLSMISYAKFLEQAKAKGEVRVHEIQDRFEPVAQRVTDRFEPITDRIEARLPEQVKEVIETGRDRVRNVLDA